MSSSNEVVSHPLFSTIIKEHNGIRGALQSAATTDQRKNLLAWLWQEVEEGNHFREEVHLFKAVLGHPNLLEGGPFCSLYFDEHIARPAKEIANKMTGSDLVWLDHQSIFKQNRSPLDIPLEEHRAAHSILVFLRSQKDILTDPQFNGYFDSYQSLLFRHMEKEERCFFRVCGALLTPNQLNLILADWMRSQYPSHR